MAKIIAQTHRGYLLDISADELANLAGYYYAGTEGCPRFQPNDEVQISKLYDQLRALANLRDRGVRLLANELHSLADTLVREIIPVITPKEEPKP